MGYSINQEKQNKAEWFRLVVDNAVYFLNSSVKNLNSSHKSSIIDLYTAIELLFKARLMKEHWSLILTKPEDADFNKFEMGDFQSVYLQQAYKRLIKVCSEKFKTEAIDNFIRLGMHRNQIVHFAHTDFKKDKVEVVLELWTSWFYIYELLSEQWSDYFGDYKCEFISINNEVQKNKHYLNEVFLIKGKEIEIELKKGSLVRTCPSCTFKSAIIQKDAPAVTVMKWITGSEWNSGNSLAKKYCCSVCKAEGLLSI